MASKNRRLFESNPVKKEPLTLYKHNSVLIRGYLVLPQFVHIQYYITLFNSFPYIIHSPGPS